MPCCLRQLRILSTEVHGQCSRIKHPTAPDDQRRDLLLLRHPVNGRGRLPQNCRQLSHCVQATMAFQFGDQVPASCGSAGWSPFGEHADFSLRRLPWLWVVVMLKRWCCWGDTGLVSMQSCNSARRGPDAAACRIDAPVQVVHLRPPDRNRPAGSREDSYGFPE
jgi:hypothetical protein